MRFSQDGGVPRPGITDGRAIAPLPVAAWAGNSFEPHDMIAVITHWDAWKEPLAAIAEFPIPIADVRLHAPIARPGKLLGIGLNYAEHAAEGGAQLPTEQMWFAMPPTAANGPYDPIKRPVVSAMLDYEVELVIIIGKRCRHLSHEAAADAIFGYCVGNDVSVRDWQLKTNQVFLGKAFDGHAPFGPWITTADVFDPRDTGIRCYVNGTQRQSSRTAQLVFDCRAQVALLSQVMTLEPGDVIFTGTPGGVGALMNPPAWLVPGDVVRAEVDGLGHIENVVEDEEIGEMVDQGQDR